MKKRFRIIILGAGFSRPAGLPLGKYLLREVRTKAFHMLGANNHLEADIDDYLTYRRLADGKEIAPEDIDFEDLMSYLDIEHYLALRGKDTWSETGNEGQEIVKRILAKTIHNSTPRSEDVPDLYLKFADSIDTSDLVITFNYDILLERALERIGKPYRLYPQRYKAVHDYHAEIDSTQEELIVLKLHGSVDWFDISSYLELRDSSKRRGFSDYEPPHPIFKNPKRYGAEPLVSGPRFPSDQLKNLYRIIDADSFYSVPYPQSTPWIISPSHSKFVYASQLEEFWYGLGRSGGWNLGFSIIGFSLPEHDEYLRRMIYTLVRNYQQSWWDDEFAGQKKTRLKLVDLRKDKNEIAALEERYRFIDKTRAKFYFNGFCDEAIDLIFRDDH